MKFTPVAATAIVPAATPAHASFPAIAAAERLLDHLARGRAIDASILRTVMTEAFDGSDAQGAWDWKAAYDAIEAATVLFLRKYGRGMQSRAGTSAALLGMLSKLAALLPSQTRRSEESQAFQQFSTPISFGFVASVAAAITSADLVLEPSAGTGLLAVFAELAGAGLALNEFADGRAALLARLFPRVPVTHYDAAHIHDHLDAGLQPSVVLMNPPFSAAAHVETRVADAALRHIASALARLAEGGRLVATTGANLSPDNASWREAFTRLQERGRIVFSAAVDGRVYARHGTTIDTRLTVIDRAPAEDPARFPPSPGTAADPETLLDWVTRLVPARQAVRPTSGRHFPLTRPGAPDLPGRRRTRPLGKQRGRVTRLWG